MIPAIMGLIGLGTMGFSMLQSIAPSGASAVEVVLTPESTRAQQRELAKSPIKQLDPSQLTIARIRRRITHEAYLNAMAENGFSSTKSETTLSNARQLLSVDNLKDAYHKHEISLDTYYNKAEQVGLSKEDATIYLKSQRTPLAPQELIMAYWREFIDRDKYAQKMAENGYTTEDAGILEKTMWFYPPVSDWLRFSVRDVFQPGIVSKYGYDENYPTDIDKYIVKAGISPEINKYYWRAHWELPSPTEVYEMLHRFDPEVLRVTGDKYKEMGFNPEDLTTDLNTMLELLKTADYPEFWRQRLAGISYDPLTRVDLKRMYEMNVLGDDKVLATLRERGYVKEDAQLLLNWYKANKNPKVKAKTSSQIMKRYANTIISESEAINDLIKLGYSSEDIDEMMRLQKLELKNKDVKDYLAIYLEEYVIGNIDRITYEQRLNELGLTNTKVKTILAKSQQKRRKVLAKTPLKDIHTFFQKKILTIEEYRDKLKRNGVSLEDIDLYIKLYSISEAET